MKSEEIFKKLNSHLGYGNINSNIVFMGLEESAPSNYIKLADNHGYRCSYLNDDFGLRKGYPINPNGIEDLKLFHVSSPLLDMNQWFSLKKRQSTWGN